MSASPKTSARLTPQDIKTLKTVSPIVCLTAYTTPMAQAVDRHCDVTLVGDSVGMVLHGLRSTVEVTLEMMILHGAAVARGISRSCLVVDMPFGSYEISKEDALRNAMRILAETGCQAVKLEGGQHMADTVDFLVRRGVPVMGHIGLTPQSVNTLGGYKVQGRGRAGDALLADAHALSDAGAFAVVLEKIPASLGRRITAAIPVPTIGIGAGVDCDGQVLVSDDMLGLFSDFRPRFVRQFASLGPQIDAAIEAYVEDVRNRRFPAPEHEFGDEAPS